MAHTRRAEVRIGSGFGIGRVDVNRKACGLKKILSSASTSPGENDGGTLRELRRGRSRHRSNFSHKSRNSEPRPVKRFPVRLFAVAAFLLVCPFFLRRRPRVERRITILAPPSAIFPFLN